MACNDRDLSEGNGVQPIVLTAQSEASEHDLLDTSWLFHRYARFSDMLKERLRASWQRRTR